MRSKVGSPAQMNKYSPEQENAPKRENFAFLIVTSRREADNVQVVQNARGGIDRLDEVRREKGLSQMKISEMAGMLDTGSLYCRMYKRGDVSLSKYIKFLRAAGCRLAIIHEEADQ